MSFKFRNPQFKMEIEIKIPTRRRFFNVLNNNYKHNLNSSQSLHICRTPEKFQKEKII